MKKLKLKTNRTRIVTYTCWEKVNFDHFYSLSNRRIVRTRKIYRNDVDGACSTRGRDQDCTQSSGRKTLVTRPHRPLQISSLKCEGTIKVDLEEIESEDVGLGSAGPR
jgi:hypothetical protein